MTTPRFYAAPTAPPRRSTAVIGGGAIAVLAVTSAALGYPTTAAVLTVLAVIYAILLTDGMPAMSGRAATWHYLRRAVVRRRIPLPPANPSARKRDAIVHVPPVVSDNPRTWTCLIVMACALAVTVRIYGDKPTVDVRMARFFATSDDQTWLTFTEGALYLVLPLLIAATSGVLIAAALRSLDGAQPTLIDIIRSPRILRTIGAGLALAFIPSALAALVQRWAGYAEALAPEWLMPHIGFQASLSVPLVWAVATAGLLWAPAVVHQTGAPLISALVASVSLARRAGAAPLIGLCTLVIGIQTIGLVGADFLVVAVALGLLMPAFAIALSVRFRQLTHGAIVVQPRRIPEMGERSAVRRRFGRSMCIATAALAVYILLSAWCQAIVLNQLSKPLIDVTSVYVVPGVITAITWLVGCAAVMTARGDKSAPGRRWMAGLLTLLPIPVLVGASLIAPHPDDADDYGWLFLGNGLAATALLAAWLLSRRRHAISVVAAFAGGIAAALWLNMRSPSVTIDMLTGAPPTHADHFVEAVITYGGVAAILVVATWLGWLLDILLSSTRRPAPIL